MVRVTMQIQFDANDSNESIQKIEKREKKHLRFYRLKEIIQKNIIDWTIFGYYLSANTNFFI